MVPWRRWIRPSAGRPDAEDAARTMVRETGCDVLWAVTHVSMEDLRAQDENFDRDSRFGRELLFLLANTEWMRNTVEDVTLEYSRSLDASLEVHVDLREITHEAFWGKERLWLPVLTLPAGGPAVWAGEGDSTFPIISVQDSGGQVRSTLPQGVVRRQLAAALAEIILNIGVARWPQAFGNAPAVRLAAGAEKPAGDDAAKSTGNRPTRPVATREQRLVLSSALLRVLDGERAPADWWPLAGAEGDEALRRPPLSVEGDGPRQRAVPDVLKFLGQYLELFDAISGSRPAGHPTPGQHAMVEMTRRTAQIIHAFRDGVVVVVGVRREETEPVLTVHVPARRLEPYGIVRWGRRHATVTVDLLAASSQTARDVRITLAQGLAGGGRRKAGASRPRSDVVVGEPDPLVQLRSLMGQLLRDVTPQARRALADLAMMKAAAVRELFTSHRLVRLHGRRWRSAGDPTYRLQEITARLRRLTSDTDDSAAIASLRTEWNDGNWLQGTLVRRTRNQTLSSGAVHLHAPAVPQSGLRPSPVSATATLKVVVSDSPLFSAARFASAMSLGLIGAVLIFVFGTNKSLNAEVAAGALTIFSAIQATRIDYPDRTTLRGVLSASGYWLVVLSILPTVMLAVTLAFIGDQNGAAGFQQAVNTWFRHLSPLRDDGTIPLDTAESAAVAAFALQLVALVVMWTGPASGRMSLIPVKGLQLRTRPTPDYNRAVPLQSSWWRTTTAEALRLGRSAHAYIVWGSADRHPGAGDDAALPSSWWHVVRQQAADQAGDVDDSYSRADAGEPGHPNGKDITNILSLVRAGTAKRSTTFFVFRDEPEAAWARRDGVTPVPLRPDRLAPVEMPPDLLHVYAGTPRDPRPSIGAHLLSRLMGECARLGLHVRDVQLPVPPPSGGPVGLRWARLQIDVHPGNTPVLGRYLSAVQRLPTPGEAVLVQLGAELPIRLLAGTADPAEPAVAAGETEVANQITRAHELDVLSGLESRDEEVWTVLVMTAPARPGIETELLGWLASNRPGMRLGGLVSAVLHGTAVLLVLGQPGAGDPATPVESALTAAFRDDDVLVVERALTGAELGRPGAHPLLRVHLRSRDRPGLIAHLMEGLNQILGRYVSDSTGESHLDPWYVLLQVVEGGTARARMTLRVPDRLGALTQWSPAQWEAAEYEVRRFLAARGAREQQGIGMGAHLDTTIIKLEVIHRRLDREAGTEDKSKA